MPVALALVKPHSRAFARASMYQSRSRWILPAALYQCFYKFWWFTLRIFLVMVALK
jgi:hypothetical protein